MALPPRSPTGPCSPAHRRQCDWHPYQTDRGPRCPEWRCLSESKEERLKMRTGMEVDGREETKGETGVGNGCRYFSF